MSRRSQAIAVFVVALFVVAACGVSFVRSADASTDACGPEKGWGPAKSDTRSSGALLLDLAAVPVAFVESAPAVGSCMALPERVDVAAGHGPAQPRAPRAPPLA